MSFSAQHIKAARLHLQKSDPIMKGIIKRVGPFTAKANRQRFVTLVRSVVSQQISGAAARTIWSRFQEAVRPDPITPESVLRFQIDDLRALGISRQKAGYVLDLASKVESGLVDLARIHRQDDQQIIHELTQVKGIGIWTAQMFMMFSLGRLDVFPNNDLGIRNAIEKNYPHRSPITTAIMAQIAQPWHPYATVASWYLWRSLEWKDEL